MNARRSKPGTPGTALAGEAGSAMPDETSGAPIAPPPAAPPSVSGDSLATAILLVIALGALYFGRQIFVPFALAVLLSFLLAPPVDWLRRLGLPRVPAVTAVVALSFVLLGAFSALVGTQVVQLAGNLPNYELNLHQKIRDLRASSAEPGALERASGLFNSLRKELQTDETSEIRPSAAGGEKPKPEPIPVRIERAEAEPLEVITGVLSPLLGPIGTAGLVLVFVVFILLERHDLRDRFLRLAGGSVHRTTGALDEAARRVSRYLLMQLVVNATYGIPLGLALWFIGVPNPLLWGLLATLLRFVPYLGPFIAAMFPLALAFAVDPGWTTFFWTAAVIIVLELISNNFVEPHLYGSSTGLSPVAVLLAAIFWTVLWGPVGLVLATPLTVCLVVLGRYVPRLEFFEVLLGSEPVLAAEERLYQRLLAGNAEEAIDVAEAEVASTSLLGFYDNVALPALRLAERDRRIGSSPEERGRIAEGLEAVVQEVCGETSNDGEAVPVLCIAGRGQLDAAAAAMLAHALRERGIGARRLSARHVAPDSIHALDVDGVDVVCLSYLHPRPQVYARFVSRRLKKRKPGLRVVVCAWDADLGTTVEAKDVHADALVTTIEEALSHVGRLAAAVPARMEAPGMPKDESDRVAALQASGLSDARERGHLDRVARAVAEAFDTPIALVSLVDESCQVWKGASGLPEDMEEARRSPRETSVCGHVVAGDAPLVVEDTLRDPRFSGNPFLRARGIRFYAGAPLRTATGHVIGSLCVLDTRPRSINAREVKLLQALADELMAGAGQPRSEEPAPA